MSFFELRRVCFRVDGYGIESKRVKLAMASNPLIATLPQ
jgi:hypothetical protein